MNKKKDWADFIPSGGVNDSIARWHADQAQREQTCASPSSLKDCPRVVWLKKQGVPRTNTMGWGQLQRLLLGRIIEDTIANQLKEDGKLLWAWTDNYAGQSKKFEHGHGTDKLAGTPDLLLRQNNMVVISDAKTSRSDSYGYVPITDDVWLDPYWYKYKLQVTAYYLLCHWNKPWFERRNLPLPEACHLFSYSLDDGIVRRELTWTPTKLDARLIMDLTRRWNQAYAAEEAPDCTCVADDTVKFCPYSIKPEGSKVGTSCCSDSILEEYNAKTSQEV